jgi:hypothetical protein
MTSTRSEISRSIDATRAVLMRLSPAQLETVRAETDRRLLGFIESEWLPAARAARLEREASQARVTAATLELAETSMKASMIERLLAERRAA